MKVLITGGGGFLGTQLCQKLVARGGLTNSSGQYVPIDEIVLFDSKFTAAASEATRGLNGHGNVRVIEHCGSIDDRDAVRSALGVAQNVSIFHLASMVSGECEEHFDDAMRVNLEGGRILFEAARALGSHTKVVFASSIACFGGDAMQTPCSDLTKLTPQTTYGMTKVICELLINDYSRKGFFDGRSARLPTVVIRPGQPNKAASGWASGMFREPLRGEVCFLPVRREQSHPMTGYRTVIESLIAIHELPADRIGRDRTIGLPARQITPALADSELRKVASERGIGLGPTVEQPDDRIRSIVEHWPTEVDGSRGVSLGIPEAPTIREIIQQYLEDFTTL